MTDTTPLSAEREQEIRAARYTNRSLAAADIDVEAKRNEIRSSYTELISTCEEMKDFEGAFDIQCRLREREEQWKREDAPFA